MTKKILKHPSIQHKDAIEAICKPLEELDIFYFSHVNINAQHQFSALGKQPDFVKLYLEKEYYNYDIHMAKAHQNEQYIIWDTIKLSKESKQLDNDFMDFSLGHTFTIINEHEDNSKDYFHFGAKLGNDSINNQYLQKIDFLKMFILYFKDKINSIKELKAGYDFKFELSLEKGGYFTKDKLENANLDNFIKAMQFNRFYFDNDKKYLTKKEFECLYWLSKGKTLDQISIILGVTLRTIHAHMSNIKKKLECDNQFQLGMLFNKVKWSHLL